MIGYEELRKILIDSGIPENVITILDSEYVLPTQEWVTTKLSNSLTKFFLDSDITYNSDQYDCNKFAKTASTIADWCWAKTKQEEAALAFGIFGYIGSELGHCINIAIHRNIYDHSLYVAFYEPQPSLSENEPSIIPICLIPKTLSKEDIQSCLCCLFL